MATRTAKYPSWRSPSGVALLGTVLVALLLTLPIYTLGPGDHEEKICGNALALDLTQWRGTIDGNYFDKAYRRCTAQRIDRVVYAVGVVSVTVLIVTRMQARTRPRDSESPNP